MTDHYASPVPFVDDRIHAAAVYCSDGRMGAAFNEFCTNGLELPRFDRVVLPGGPACLAGHEQAVLEEQAVLDELTFLVEAHELDRVVLIQHAGCAFYGARLGVGPDDLADRQREDLIKAAAAVRKAMPDVRVEGWMLVIKGEQISFEPAPVR